MHGSLKIEVFRGEIRELINLGATICEKIKEIYYPAKPWVECHKDVSIKFSQLKKIAKTFYVDKTDKEVLMELVRYSPDDIKDCFT